MLKKILGFALLLCLLVSPASALVYELEDGRTVMVSVGGSFAYSRDTAGNIRVWGDNQFGQLGKGNTKQSFAVADFKTKQAELDVSHMVDVVTATDFSFMWMDDGSMFGVGSNVYLPLTMPQDISYSTHVRVNLPEPAAAVATGFGHVLILTENGEVYAWGRNSQGQVGNGKTVKTNVPYKLPLQNIVQIACGGKFSLALDKDGVLWGWGDNEYHQLSPDSHPYQPTPAPVDYGGVDIAYIDAGDASVVLLDKNGVLWTWGRNHVQELGYDTNGQTTSAPRPVPLPLPVTFVAAYSYQTYAILTDGSLWSWGNNTYGQLGQGFRTASGLGVLPGKAYDKDVVLVQGGSLYCVAMLKDGTILTAGISKFGQQGDGTDQTKPTLAPNGMNLIVN